jgi:hypothetical protein
MATDYNANLIAELYTTENAEKATNISDEMVEIGDPIFPRQIYEAYKKFQKTNVSHYFVSDLVHFKSGDAVEILKEIAHKTNRDADILMMIEYFTDIEYFDDKVVNKVEKLFKEEIISREIQEYDMERYFEYLKKFSQKKEDLEYLLKICFEDNEQNISVRRIALKKLLQIKPKEYIKYYYENYDSIRDRKTEIIFVEEISTWYGGTIPLLHKKILETGSNRAREILEKEQSRKVEKKVSEEKEEQKKIRREYETSDVISDIAELRSKINKISTVDERFGFPIFSSFEEIYQQGKPAKDKATLRGYCMVIRSLLGGFENKILEFEISEERAKALIPTITDFSGSINKFHLLLLEKKINVDKGIFGLRNINRIIVKFAAHTEEEATSGELIDILREEKLFNYYKEDNWSKLHREILLRYKEVLEKLINALIIK